MLAYKIKSGTPEAREAAVLQFKTAAALSRHVALLGAKAVLELERTDAHRGEGASSIAPFGEMNGLSAAESRTWANLALAISHPQPSDEPASRSVAATTMSPGESLGAAIESEVASGTIPVASAAVLGEVIRFEMNAQREIARAAEKAGKPAPPAVVVQLDPEWLELARVKSTRDFRRHYLRRIDEWKGGGPTTRLLAYVTNSIREDLARARVLASRKAQNALSMGQVLGLVVGEWLDKHDPMRKDPGTRRLPDTATIPGSRYVPAEVDRHVRARSDDECIVPFCDADMWLHRSHRVAHRDGGSREAHQLDLLCPYHHFLYETGCILITGPADAPIVTDYLGRPIDRRRTWLVRSDDPMWASLWKKARESISTSSNANGGDPPRLSSGPSPSPSPESSSRAAPASSDSTSNHSPKSSARSPGCAGRGDEPMAREGVSDSPKGGGG